MQWLELSEPNQVARPLIVEVPHAGLWVPGEIGSELNIDTQTLKRDADLYVDELYADSPSSGATLLSTSVSRYVVDLNRNESDVDPLAVMGAHMAQPGQPRGVIWRTSTDGNVVLARPLTPEQLEHRVKTYYRPYHQLLQQRIDELKAVFGYVLILAGHSMPSVGRAGHKDIGVRRADIVPGTQGRSTASAKLIDMVDAHFRSAGLSIAHDDPYKGGFTTSFYGRPVEQQHAIQIEINRAVYMDETTFEKRTPNFGDLKNLLSALVAKLSTVTPS